MPLFIEFMMRYIRTHRFLLLLVFLVLGIVIPSFIQHHSFHNLIVTIIFTLTILCGLYAFGQNTKFLRTSTVFFVLAIVAAWISFFREGEGIYLLTKVAFFVIVFSTLLVKTLITIRRSQEIDLNIIFSSLVGYILIGYLGGLIAIGVSIGYQDSFNIEGPLSTMVGIYYSFVTMTTLGYGDITPVGPQARSLAVLLSIIGPMYVAILIALLVGKYSSAK